MSNFASAAQQLADSLRKFRWRVAVAQPRPLSAQELLGYPGIRFARVVDHNGYEERRVVRHVQEPPGREIPLPPEVAFYSRIGMRGNHWKEQCALVDLLANLRIPGVTCAQGIRVEPDLDARHSQGFTDTPGCLRILGSVREEDRTLGVGLFRHQQRAEYRRTSREALLVQRPNRLICRTSASA